MGQQLKTAVLIAALTALILYIGRMMGGQQGLIIAFAFALIMNFGMYWFSDRLVLAMYRAKPVDRESASRLYGIVERLCERAGLPMPKVYMIPSEHPNAFATGRNPKHAAVAVTQGLLRLLDEEELTGVLAHELGHVQNRDTLISTIAGTLAAVITHLAYMARWAMIFGMGGRHGDDNDRGNPLGLLLVTLVAPIAAMVIQMAISRSREFFADEAGARLAGHPMGLVRALEKLHYASTRIPLHHANPATAHLFIVNPFSGGGIVKLFSTHPPIEERIERLRSMVY